MTILKHTSHLSALAVQLSVVLLVQFLSARSTFRPLIEDNGYDKSSSDEGAITSYLVLLAGSSSKKL
ncbi:MAG: hypothetical protein ACJATI_005201 [Halioglobus sp.]|jgi:hypothetical protein